MPEFAKFQCENAGKNFALFALFCAYREHCCAYPIPIPDPASLLRNLPFHVFAPQMRIEPGCDGWKLTTVTTTLRSLQQHDEKRSCLNQMYKKGNGSICEEKKYRECSIRLVTSLKKGLQQKGKVNYC